MAIETLSALASAATTIVLPSVLEKTSEALGEKLVETAIEKSSKMVQLVHKKVQEKLLAKGTDILLRRAEEQPTAQNIQVLEGELVNQMSEDKEFAAQLNELIQQIQTKSPSLQVVLDTVRVKGSVEIGSSKQISKSNSSEQVFGHNLGVGGDLRIGDVSQIQGLQED